LAQDLLKITPEALELQLYKIPAKNLVKMIEDIYEYKWTHGKFFTVDRMKDIEKKETKILAELQRRNYFTKKENQQYFDWIKKLNYKKRLY